MDAASLVRVFLILVTLLGATAASLGPDTRDGFDRDPGPLAW
jgi:hypothetical protein